MTIDTNGAVQVIQTYMQALQAGNKDAILSLYAPDAEIIPEEAASLSGLEAISRFYEGVVASIRIDGELNVTSVEVHGDIALVRSEEPATVLNLATGERANSYFRELFVLREAADGWQIYKYMFSQNPAQASNAVEVGGGASASQKTTGLQKAKTPAELGQLWLERANAGDVDAILDLYEPGATMYFKGQASVGREALRTAYNVMLAGNPQMVAYPNGTPRMVGDLALTSTVLPLENPVLSGAITSEVARRQPDGTWLWVLDEANILPNGWGPQS